VIIGAGLAGIAVALRLRRLGHAVTVLERSDDYGGKLGTFDWNGFRWDRGPSLFTEPQLIDDLFLLYGKDPRAYFNYVPSETACTYFFPGCDPVIFYTDRNRLKAEISGKFGVALAEKTLRYIEGSRSAYERIGTFFTDNPQPEMKDIFRKELLVRYPHFLSARLGKTLHGYNKMKLGDHRLVQLFDRFGTYNGSDPFRMSGLYSMIPHLEHNDGTYFPEKGMRSIVDIHTNQELLIADKLVCAIDHLPFYRDILRDSELYEKYAQQERSSSALVFYWAVDRAVPSLGLHSVFFSADYAREFAAIFGSGTFPSEPTVYVHVSSIANPADAPDGCQNWFVMINMPSGVVPDAAQTDALRRFVLERVGKQLGVSIDRHILFERMWNARGIEEDTGSEAGALYGASSNGKLAALKRHGNRNSRYPNLYFCGGTVHPGGGIPLVLRSARIVEQLIAHEK
jgi:phytoene dehydrogenase-like protein